MTDLAVDSAEAAKAQFWVCTACQSKNALKDKLCVQCVAVITTSKKSSSSSSSSASSSTSSSSSQSASAAALAMQTTVNGTLHAMPTTLNGVISSYAHNMPALKDALARLEAHDRMYRIPDPAFPVTLPKGASKTQKKAALCSAFRKKSTKIPAVNNEEDPYHLELLSKALVYIPIMSASMADTPNFRESSSSTASSS